jgi:hypothetical protein
MSVQHYFVVACDEEGNWFVDHGTAEARFRDGTTWDEDTETWRYATRQEGDSRALIDLEKRLA